MAIYSGQTTGTQQGDIDAGYIVNGTYLQPGAEITPLSSTAPSAITPTATPGTTDANFLLGKYTPDMPSYDPTASPTMTSESLTNTSPIPLVSPNTTPVFPTSTLQTTPELQPTSQEQKASGISTELGTLYNSLVGESAYRTQQEQQFGVPAAQQTINDLNTQLIQLKSEAAAIPLQLEQNASQRGITTTSLGRQENSRLRTNAIAALGVSALMAAAQGQLANAQSLADRAVAQKYDPIREQIEALTANLNLIMNDPLTSLQDRNRAQAQIDIQNARSLAINEAKANEQEIWGIATTAAQNGSGFTPSGQYTNLAQTLQAISQAPTKEAALLIAVQTGLLSEPAGSDTKILGSASTGYFTYDPATGTTTPISGGSGGTGGTGGGITNDNFTQTQLNKGIAYSGLSPEDFNRLSYEEQNLFVNNGAIEDYKDIINDEFDAGSDPQALEGEISSSNLPPAIKDFLVRYLWSVFPRPTQETSTPWWKFW